MTLYYLKNGNIVKIYTDKLELLIAYAKNKNAKIYTKNIGRIKKWIN